MAQLPPHVVFARVVPLATHLSGRTRGTLEFNVEAATMWMQLAQLLVMLHKRDIIVRDLRVDNVVRSKTGSHRCWTLLEFANVTRSGALAMSVTPQTAPPEVRRSAVAAQRAAELSAHASSRPVHVHCARVW